MSQSAMALSMLACKRKFTVRFLLEMPLYLSNGNLVLVFLLVLPKLGALEVGLNH